MKSLLVFVCLGVPVVTRAQSLQIEGHVARSTVDGERLVPRLQVTLHRIGTSQAGPVDSTLTNTRGQYRFVVARPDTAAMYLATARFGGIAYFANPVRVDDPVVEGEIHVFDTTSTRIALEVAGHHIVVAAPGVDGWRMVTEVWELANDTVLTRLSRVGDPAFTVPVPPGARNPRSTQGDYPGSALVVADGRAGIVAPVPPGIRQLVLTYDLPPSAFPWRLTTEDTSAVVEVLLEEAVGVVQGGALAPLGAVPSEGRNFLRFLGRDVPGGTRLEITLPRPADRGSRWPWVAGLSMAALGAVWWALRGRRAAPVTAVATPTKAASRAEELQSALAGVDHVLADEATRSESRAALQEYRASLQRELDRVLAPSSDAE